MDTLYKSAKLCDCNNDLNRRWYVYYSFKSPESGKPERFRVYIPSSIKTKSGRRDHAHTLIKQLNQKLAEGWNPYAFRDRKSENILLAVDAMIRLKLSATRKRTSYTYRNHVKKFKDWLLAKKYGSMHVSDFNKQLAQDYLDHLKIASAYKNRTFNNHLMSLKAVFRMLVEREYCLANPFLSMKPMPVDEPEIIAFTDEDLQLVATTLPKQNARLWLVAQLIYYCFLRPQEIVRLRFSDINYAQQQINIAGTRSKNGRTQCIDIPDPLYHELLALRDGQPDMLIFSTGLLPGNTEIAQPRIDEAWAVYRDMVGLSPEKTIYAFKHTGVGKLMDAGVDARSIQLQVRHSSLEETQKYLDRFRRRPNQTLRSNFPKLG